MMRDFVSSNKKPAAMMFNMYSIPVTRVVGRYGYETGEVSFPSQAPQTGLGRGDL